MDRTLLRMALLVGLAGVAAGGCGENPRTVHFVTHSMGGVLVWTYLAEQPEAHLGRVVMLSPPSQGSELSDALGESPLVRLILGPAGMELGTDSTSVASRLGPAEFPLGIIAGLRTGRFSDAARP